MTAPTLPPEVESAFARLNANGSGPLALNRAVSLVRTEDVESLRAAIAAAIAPPAVPASVERRMAFMEVERRVEEAVKARDARIARMEEVLRFYARQSTWAGSYCATTGIHGEPDAYYDKGAKARAALDEWTAKS